MTATTLNCRNDVGGEPTVGQRVAVTELVHTDRPTATQSQLIAHHADQAERLKERAGRTIDNRLVRFCGEGTIARLAGDRCDVTMDEA